METAKAALSQMKKGHATILWGKVAIRIGDKWIVGESVSIREAGTSLEEAAAKFCTGPRFDNDR